MSTYPDRNVLYRYMGPPAEYPCCDGRGWRVVEDDDDTSREVYCDCACGTLRARLERGAE